MSRVEVKPGQRADETVAAILLDQLAVARENLADAGLAKRPEALHELRKALRRTRTLLREFPGVFPPDELARFKQGLRELQRSTNAVRDLDVLLAELDQVGTELEGLAPARAEISRRRSAEATKLRRHLRTAQTAQLLDDWQSLLEGLPAKNGDGGRTAAEPVERIAGRRINKRYRKLVAQGEKIEGKLPPDKTHEFRKRGKDLRYTLQFFGPLFPKSAVEPLEKDLKIMHDLLGDFQDRVTHEPMLREAADRLAGENGGAEPVVAIGELLEEAETAQKRTVKDFAKRFDKFSGKARRKAVSKKISP